MTVPFSPSQLFQAGHDTADIASILGKTEAEIYNGRGYVERAPFQVEPPRRGLVYLGHFRKECT